MCRKDKIVDKINIDAFVQNMHSVLSKMDKNGKFHRNTMRTALECIEQLQKESDEQQADGFRICLDCNRNMLSSKGCTQLFMLINNNYYKRIPVLSIGVTNDRCHDCGALPGKTHHIECDMEICPICKESQFITCNCVAGKDIKTVNIMEIKK
ncbi:hypothetical protein LCGC14_1007060 [marine sediment metagenome]|uniref:Uncharacterized protein n=1 Tax=marine sediment metagenome TaxID=412755 RepID=A0A0F9NMW9_9ZZZZ